MLDLLNMIKKTGTIQETRTAISDFNDQLEVVIRVKQGIQARFIGSSTTKSTEKNPLSLRQTKRTLSFGKDQRQEEMTSLRLRTKA